MNHGLTASMTALATVAIGLLLASSNTIDWVPVVEGWTSEPEPVLVIVVGSPELVAGVREAIESERIRFESPDAFALTEGRIVASTAEAASDPINALGWIERDIEMVSVVIDGGRRWEANRDRSDAPANGSTEDDAQAKQIAALVNKPSLNYAEATLVLQHMDTTGQF